MPFKALIIFIAALSFCVVSSKPTVPRGNYGNGNFGFKYEVSHYPGNSRMHMNTGGSSSNHQATHIPYHGTNKHGEGGYIPNSPIPSEYHPNHYENDAKAPIGHSSHSPEIIHEPQPEYQSPYDSAAKNQYNGNDVYQGDGKPYIANDDYPSSVHSSPIPDERDSYIHHPNKDIHAPEPYPEEYGNAPASQEHINPHISQEHINPPISQKYINPPVSHGHANRHTPQKPIYPTISQEYISSPASHEYVNPPVAHELVNPHSPQEYIYPPVSQEHVSPYIPQESISPPLSQEYINPPVPEYVNHPVAQEHVNPHIPQEPIYPPVSHEQVNPHISQEYVNLPVSKKNSVPHIHQEPAPILVEYTNLSVKTDYIDAPISQDSINPHISQEYVGNPVVSQENIIPSIKQPYPSISVVEPEPLEQVSVPTYDEPNKESEPVPVGSQYQFIPSGPPYVTNSHTTQIIHPPLPDSHNTGFIEESIDNSPSIDEVKPASVSHAFRLPIPVLSPASSGPHIDQIAPEDHIEDNLPVISPISHSTRLLLPSSGPAEESDVADLLPKSQLDVKSPGSFQNIADDLSPFAPFPQTADLKSLQIEAGNAPGFLGAAHGPVTDEPVIPPISHAFRLNLPGVVIPSLQLPPNPEVNPVEEKVSSALDEASVASSLDVPHAPRISHAFRLSLPSSQNHNLNGPQVENVKDLSIDDASKSSDYALLALESKSIK